MRCPYCNFGKTRVLNTTHDVQGNVRRRRECQQCHRRFSTIERAILTTPLVIKRDGRREEFDPHKLLSGLRIACSRRPISSESLDHIVEHVLHTIRQSGEDEIPSTMIGDLVIEALRQLDEVAYIRYAIVYMGLRDLEAVRKEIDRLRAQSEDR